MKPILKRLFEIDFFFSNILIPLGGLVVYCASFVYLSSRFQLEGVNYFFASKLSKIALVLLVGAILSLFLILRANSSNQLVYRKNAKQLHPSDLLLLFIPLTPVVQYVLSNQEILSHNGSLNVVLFFAIFSAIYIFALPTLLNTMIPVRTLMILGVAFVFTIASMASISDHFAWFEQGALRKQLPVLAGAFLVIGLFYVFERRKILYLFIVLSFTVNIFSQLLMQNSQANPPAASMEENKLSSLIGKRIPSSTPNIYLLVYDAYIPNETMLAYGIDNSAQEDFLSEQGFTLYPHTYSIAGFTVGTMSRVLNASNQFYGSARRGVSGDGVVQGIAKRIGYQTYGLFPYDFMFQGIGSSYDFSIPKEGLPPYLQLLKAIFLGEFRFDIQDIGYGQQTREQFIQAKQEIFKNITDGPVFIYMHTNAPAHSQNSGACLADETEQFKARLTVANLEMRQDIQLIVEHDPNAIVIVAGDHGPYLTKNCMDTGGIYDMSEISRLDIQDRFGTFLAIRWPSGDYEKYDDITVLQDLFPAVFAYLYKDPTILQAKIEPIIPVQPNGTISGASVNNGIIVGGIDNGEPLYLSGE